MPNNANGLHTIDRIVKRAKERFGREPWAVSQLMKHLPGCDVMNVRSVIGGHIERGGRRVIRVSTRAENGTEALYRTASASEAKTLPGRVSDVLVAWMRARWADGAKAVDAVQLGQLVAPPFSRESIKSAMEKLARRGYFCHQADEMVERLTPKGTVQRVRQWTLRPTLAAGHTESGVCQSEGSRALESVPWLTAVAPAGEPRVVRGRDFIERERAGTTERLGEMADRERRALRV
jgi:hypothetical protein